MLKLLVCTLSVVSAFSVHREPAKPALDRALALRGGLSVEKTSLLGAVYLGGFGVTLAANPDSQFQTATRPCSPQCTRPLSEEKVLERLQN